MPPGFVSGPIQYRFVDPLPQNSNWVRCEDVTSYRRSLIPTQWTHFDGDDLTNHSTVEVECTRAVSRVQAL